MEVQTKVVLFYKRYPNEAFLACYLSKSVRDSFGTQAGNVSFSFNQTSNRVILLQPIREPKNMKIINRTANPNGLSLLADLLGVMSRPVTQAEIKNSIFNGQRII